MSLQETIFALEDRLIHEDFSTCPEQLEALLDAGFTEISPDGKTVSRQEVISWLLAKDPSSRWAYTDFQVEEQGSDLVEATYHAKQVVPENPGSMGARHVSRWQKADTADGWQLVVHQSERIS